ncbi:unnamed protein product [Phytophthora fragariaefolia]|uniref:Unnamed protein product n=1 Tax=Phytophthora fragariaefolia TaxID=1490495 RepID=A0A9W6XR06_9STRA|nr:unnamed protein product [Phytophthora fragariaefolia]
MAKFCPECGAQATGGKFCSECGTRYADDAPSAPAFPAATAVASAFRRESSAYGGGTYQHDAVPPPPPPPPVAPYAQPYARKAVPSAFRSSFSSDGSTPPAADPVPPAATGAEAQQVYDQCVRTIRGARGGGNERGVKDFKQNCRRFGLKEMDVQAFYASLVAELGAEGASSFVPTLARLVPDDDRRKELVDYNAQQRGGGRPSAFSSR